MSNALLLFWKLQQKHALVISSFPLLMLSLCVHFLLTEANTKWPSFILMSLGTQSRARNGLLRRAHSGVSTRNLHRGTFHFLNAKGLQSEVKIHAFRRQTGAAFGRSGTFLFKNELVDQMETCSAALKKVLFLLLFIANWPCVNCPVLHADVAQQLEVELRTK